jgi:hypothetical protein
MAKNINLDHPTADAVIRGHVRRLQELANSLYVVDIAGGNGAGARTANGAVVGDTLLAAVSTTNTTALTRSTDFSCPQVVATINSLTQAAGTNLTGAPLLGVLMKTNV